MFRSGGTAWLLVFIGLIFVAVITGADPNDPDDPDDDILEECKDEDYYYNNEDEEFDYNYDNEEAGSNNLSVIEPEGKVLK